MEFSTLVKAVDALYPNFAPECFISFYGGEPLLAFDLLSRAVEHIDILSTEMGVKIRYSLTTNGSLLNKDILGFLDQHGFSLMVSFDGLAQDLQRKKGSLDFLTSVIPEILARPRISLMTNSVFSSETVDYLFESVQLIIQLGVRKLDLNIAHKPPWNPSSLLRLEEEIARVGELFLSRYTSLKDVPWSGLSEELEPAVHRCPAGLDRMAVSAQGRLWGCAVLAQYFEDRGRTADYEKYCFDDVSSFIQDPQRTIAQKAANYSALRMDRFSTPDRSCLICGEIEQCWICPVAAALTTGEIGRIPGWRCQAAKILRKERRLLLGRFSRRQHHVPETSSD